MITVGTVYVANSLSVSVPATGDPITAITLTNPIVPGETVAISFQVIAESMPNPNPIQNVATAVFVYTVSPGSPDEEIGNAKSNRVVIPVFRNNVSQPINDLINSIAQQQAAIAAIANAEGSKISRMAAMPNMTPEVLLCLNKSVIEMMDSITMLEGVLKQKLGIVDCQIHGESC